MKDHSPPEVGTGDDDGCCGVAGRRHRPGRVGNRTVAPMTPTAIQWTDETWNPTTGCDKVSPGCDNCYALTMAKRLKGMGARKYQNDGDPATSGPGFGLTMHEDALSIPLSWRKPRRVFVNSMSDLFHKDVTDEFLARVFATMAMTPDHTYQILTKRHARMRSLMSSEAFVDQVRGALMDLAAYCHRQEPFWPLSNVWLGVSAEDQKWADIRIPALLKTPAVVRFVSAEPLLGPIDLSLIDFDGVTGLCALEKSPVGLDWVIVGGESGPGSRPMRPDWARQIRDQCNANGTAFFFKQWGEWGPTKMVGLGVGEANEVCLPDSSVVSKYNEGRWFKRVGKKLAGRELDGRTWDEMPA
jgi:protein gp37